MPKKKRKVPPAVTQREREHLNKMRRRAATLGIKLAELQSLMRKLK